MVQLALGLDHMPLAGEGDALLLLAIPALWILGVVLFVLLKLRVR